MIRSIEKAEPDKRREMEGSRKIWEYDESTIYRTLIIKGRETTFKTGIKERKNVANPQFPQ